MSYDISVIITTYNRAKDLKNTLESMVKTEKEDLSIEFIVVDNGSTDQTKLIIDSFSNRLRIQYIFESQSGKNRAINTAIEKSKLGKIIVFTDDDVDVSPDWFVSIRLVCDRWPNHAVFGGRIKVVFPIEKVPKWAFDPHIKALGFGHHDYSEIECIYKHLETPFGSNYWVRREVFENGRRFDEAIGPGKKNRIMGSETSFLIALLQDNYEIVYSPNVIVSHRIQPETLRYSSIYRRAYRCGRGRIRIFGLPQHVLLKAHPVQWWVYRCGAIAWNTFKLLFSILFSPNEKRLVNCVPRITDFAYQIEAVRLARKYRRNL
jgi:glycosyltransferase involved in cell wall biosynthesis